jgi:hypothetical protein
VTPPIWLDAAGRRRPVLAAAWQPAVSAAITESRTLLGGVTVAAGDVDGVAGAEIITGAGPGGGPHVKVFQANGAPLGGGFFAYAPFFRGGVRVATCDFDGDLRDDVLVGPGPGGGAHVRGFNETGVPTALSFFAY